MKEKELISKVQEVLGQELVSGLAVRKRVVLQVNRKSWKECLALLSREESLSFYSLWCLIGMSSPQGVWVIAELVSKVWEESISIRVLVSRLDTLDSLEELWPAANWYEWEIWEMFGVEILNKYRPPHFLLRDVKKASLCGEKRDGD